MSEKSPYEATERAQSFLLALSSAPKFPRDDLSKGGTASTFVKLYGFGDRPHEYPFHTTDNPVPLSRSTRKDKKKI